MTTGIDTNEMYVARVTSYATLFLASGCLVGSIFLSNHVARTWLSVAGVVAGVASEVTAGQAMRRERLLNDRMDIETTIRNRALFEGTPQPVAAQVAKPIDSGIPKPTAYTITDLNKAPHILLYGGTGDGKSTFGDWLVDEVLDGLLIDLNPHLDKRDGGEHFEPTSVEECITALHEYERGERTCLRVGAGRNMEAIAMMLAALGGLMDERYELGWMNSHVQFNIRIEESPIIANSDISKEVWKQVSKPAIREARKVKLRYVIVTQSKRVNALSWQGAGDLLDNLVQVRLGGMATEYATKNCIESVNYWLRNDKKAKGYCWLVGDEWCPVQDLTYRESVTAGGLSSFEMDIYKVCKAGVEVSASDLKRSHRHLKDVSPDDIRAAFTTLGAANYGTLTGEDKQLKFTRF